MKIVTISTRSTGPGARLYYMSTANLPHYSTDGLAPLSNGIEPPPTTNPDASLQGDAKARYVKGMFSRIARRYDLMNSIMSFGQDEMWRRYTVRKAHPKPGGLALDVATGTGMIARELARNGSYTIGIDFTLSMMEEGRARGIGEHEPVYFAGANALELPFDDNTFDCITTGFAMRNVIDIEGAFREMRRVVKPGGKVVCLEVGRPRLAVTRLFHSIYTRGIVPLLGKVLTGDSDAYTYLPSSMGKFPPPPEIARIMRTAGLRFIEYRQLTFGAVAVHSGTK
jgi:demethylmenaquinone methyltransferase/2-methoxy-6-polyprenyl-1,4-benzoquinol methylase